MARQASFTKFIGKIGDLIFYQTKDGYFVKTKGGAGIEKVMFAPSMVRTRENYMEFGSASRSGKWLRFSVKGMMRKVMDKGVYGRMMTDMVKIVRMDTLSRRGERVVGIGINDPAAKALLRGFEFNANAEVRNVLLSTYALDTLTGVITFTNVMPTDDVVYPKGATHFSLKGAYSNVNFMDKTVWVDYTNVVNLKIDGTATTVTLTPTGIPAGTGTKFYFLMIEFFQAVNGVQYAFNDGDFNGMKILEVV